MVAKRHNLQQVHGGDQSPFRPSWNSFVGTGIHNGRVPPPIQEILKHQRVTYTMQDVHTNTHTQK